MHFFETLHTDSDLGRIMDATWDSPMGVNWSSSD